MQFIHSVLAQNVAVTAGTVVTYDLPVNPLSGIFLTLKFAQNQANTQLATANILAMMSKVEVLWKGSSVYSSSGADLFSLSGAFLGFEGVTQNAGGDDNDLRSFTWYVPLGRRAYDPKECFPRSTRGELILQITYAAAFTQIDGVSAQFETIELPDANPSQHLRVTTLSVTPSATGDIDIELPIGNPIAGVLFWGTTIPAATTATTTLGEGRLLVDNQERYFSKTNFETWRNIFSIRERPIVSQGSHIHQIDGAAFAQYMDTSAVKYEVDKLGNYCIWDFDPLRDGTYLLETAGKSDIVARINAGDTSAIRVLPLELVRS